MANEKYADNKAKAAQMKGKVERHVMNCPCCHKQVARERRDPKNIGKILGEKALESHLRVCK